MRSIVDRLTLKRPQAYIRRDSKVPIKEIPGSAPPNTSRCSRVTLGSNTATQQAANGPIENAAERACRKLRNAAYEKCSPEGTSGLVGRLDTC